MHYTAAQHRWSTVSAPGHLIRAKCTRVSLTELNTVHQSAKIQNSAPDCNDTPKCTVVKCKKTSSDLSRREEQHKQAGVEQRHREEEPPLSLPLHSTSAHCTVHCFTLPLLNTLSNCTLHCCTLPFTLCHCLCSAQQHTALCDAL